MTTDTTLDGATHSDAEPDGDSPGGHLPGWATDRAMGWLLTLTGIVGWFGSAMLTWERLHIYENPLYQTSCDVNPLVSCGSVMRTWQAELFGFPNPLLGIVGYALVIMAGLALLAARGPLARWWWVCVWLGTVFAAGFLVWLWSQALFVIEKLCIYCMVAWAATIPLFVLLTARMLLRGELPASDGLRRLAGEWAWVAVAVVYTAVIASVLAVFVPLALDM